jgi:hypothetical protein
MKTLQPLSEDFLYWSPEEICTSTQESGIEDNWFIEKRNHRSRQVNQQNCIEVCDEKSA